jgi:hypothetical protein
MPLLLALSLVIQLLFVVHVYRSGAPRYWVFVILAFPVAGCLAYVVFEVLPHTREASIARSKVREIVKAFDPERDLRAKANELALCGSIDNRVALAEECVAAKLPDEAVRLYRSCLVGAYEDDPHLLFGLARALVEQGANDEAADTIARLRAAHPCHKANEARLLNARLLEARGETATALGEYRELVLAYVGLEAKCRYAQLLDRLGHDDQARAVFEEVVAQSKRISSPIASEAAWAAIARRHLKKQRV